jgi:hypothetical protein
MHENILASGCVKFTGSSPAIHGSDIFSWIAYRPRYTRPNYFVVLGCSGTAKNKYRRYRHLNHSLDYGSGSEFSCANSTYSDISFHTSSGIFRIICHTAENGGNTLTSSFLGGGERPIASPFHQIATRFCSVGSSGRNGSWFVSNSGA